jgi:hypothetical protein
MIAMALKESEVASGTHAILYPFNLISSQRGLRGNLHLELPARCSIGSMKE